MGTYFLETQHQLSIHAHKVWQSSARSVDADESAKSFTRKHLEVAAAQKVHAARDARIDLGQTFSWF